MNRPGPMGSALVLQLQSAGDLALGRLLSAREGWDVQVQRGCRETGGQGRQGTDAPACNPPPCPFCTRELIPGQ